MNQEHEHSHHGKVTDAELKKRLAGHLEWIETDGKAGEQADLSDVVDLMGGRLAGANLAGAIMPPHLRRFRELIHVDQTVAIARPIYLVMLFICIYAMIAVRATDDHSIITNEPIQILPDMAVGIPVSSFIVVVPILIIGVYIYLHLYLYRMWQILGNLPSVFHDGTPLEQAISPWLATAFVRFYQKYGVQKPSLLGVTQRLITSFLLWWLAPLTLVLIWARYLVRHEWTGTYLHIVLVALAIWSALILHRFAVAGLRNEKRPLQETSGKVFSVVLLVGIGAGIYFFSAGAIEGTRKGFAVHDPKTWVPNLLNTVGMLPCANLVKASLSGSDLSERDLRCADLSGANLRVTNLSHTDLRGARLTKARLEGAVLKFARLDEASLWNTELIKANLSNAILKRANLNIARLDGSDFRGADLQGAKLNGASLVGVDFSKANLEGAELSDANLEQAELQHANLRHSDLGLASLRGASLLRANLLDADLIGTVLDDADMSKVKGLDQVQLDNACGTGVRGLAPYYTIKQCPNNQNNETD